MYLEDLASDQQIVELLLSDCYHLVCQEWLLNPRCFQLQDIAPGNTITQ